MNMHGAGDDVVSALLAQARAHIERYTPEQAAHAMEEGALLVDLRPLEYRLRHGEVPGAVAVSRHVLEWRLDVTSEARLKELAPGDTTQEIILLCNHGYTSSLAAYQVRRDLGLSDVKDVAGGFAAWQAAGLPVVPRLAVQGLHVGNATVGSQGLTKEPHGTARDRDPLLT